MEILFLSYNSKCGITSIFHEFRNKGIDESRKTLMNSKIKFIFCRSFIIKQLVKLFYCPFKWVKPAEEQLKSCFWHFRIGKILNLHGTLPSTMVRNVFTWDQIKYGPLISFCIIRKLKHEYQQKRNTTTSLCSTIRSPN